MRNRNRNQRLENVIPENNNYKFLIKLKSRNAKAELLEILSILIENFSIKIISCGKSSVARIVVPGSKMWYLTATTKNLLENAGLEGEFKLLGVADPKERIRTSAWVDSLFRMGI